ncbi:hypothetical protein B0T13DRAFT_450135 [Neurospora crassa]|nr:hypothetical protein B0T13DRAFT_450135 [Neurospora crassa]
MWYGCVLVATAASRVGGRVGGSGRATIDGGETSRCQLVCGMKIWERGRRSEEGKRCGSAMSHAPPMLLLLLTHTTPAQQQQQQQQQHFELTEDTLLEVPSPREQGNAKDGDTTVNADGQSPSPTEPTPGSPVDALCMVQAQAPTLTNSSHRFWDADAMRACVQERSILTLARLRQKGEEEEEEEEEEE